jgi:hypothetical protein
MTAPTGHPLRPTAYPAPTDPLFRVLGRAFDALPSDYRPKIAPAALSEETP